MDPVPGWPCCLALIQFQQAPQKPNDLGGNLLDLEIYCHQIRLLGARAVRRGASLCDRADDDPNQVAPSGKANNPCARAEQWDASQ